MMFWLFMQVKHKDYQLISRVTGHSLHNTYFSLFQSVFHIPQILQLI
jgi:hypothetical protein